jgi:hypothetical protein
MKITLAIQQRDVENILDELLKPDSVHTAETRGFLLRVLKEAVTEYDKLETECDRLRPAIERVCLTEDGIIEYEGRAEGTG